ncbi:MAG: diaminopimelate epimerase [Actinomycetota bacterium]|nr:diaminopimelate epimerase [Actinomycetota bacterium]
MPHEDSNIVLTKHEGLGNDFLIAVEPARPLTADDARAWCDRHRGVGADGLISLTSVVRGSATGAGLAVMALWNADGSAAEISGNGIRCVAQALAMHSGVCGPATFEVGTDAGLRRLSLDPTDDPHIVNVRVDMGSAGVGVADSTAWADLGVELIRQQGVDLGNPHLVALVDEPDRYDISVVGPKVEAAYPDGLNVHLAKVIDRHSVTMKVWERGSGVTEACGSGACAVGVATTDWGLVDSPITVNMPGGAVTVEVGETVHLTGPARFIARVEMP